MIKPEASKWQLYDRLIDGIPQDSEVQDCLVGMRWILVRSDNGVGMSLTSPDGKQRLDGSGTFRGRKTRELATLIKSWNTMEAAIGVAAVNSYYNAPGVFARSWDTDLNDQPEANAFEHYKDRLTGKKVAVVGHFPGLEDLAAACELSILERRPRDNDFPDPACEYIFPQQDAVFITGTTLINKTLPRLLELSSGRISVVVGPSTPLTPLLFEYGASALAGTVVMDGERAWRFVAEGGDRRVFAHGVRMVKVDPGMVHNAQP